MRGIVIKKRRDKEIETERKYLKERKKESEKCNYEKRKKTTEKGQNGNV